MLIGLAAGSRARGAMTRKRQPVRITATLSAYHNRPHHNPTRQGNDITLPSPPRRRHPQDYVYDEYNPRILYL